MTMYPVLLLPFVALAMMIFLPLFGGDKNISKKFRSRKRRKIWLGRLAVFMLLLSTVLTLAWPVHGMSSLVQGLLITALVMIPAIVFHLLASLHYGSSSNGFSRWSNDDDNEEQWFDSDGDKSQAATAAASTVEAKQAEPAIRAGSTAIPLSSEDTQRRQSSSAIPLSSEDASGRRSTSAIHLSAEPSSDQKASAIPLSSGTQKDRFSTPIELASENSSQGRSEAISLGQERDESSRSIILGSDENRTIRTTPEVEEQLSQVSKLVQSHDIGGDSNLDDDSAIPIVDKPIRAVPQSVLNQSMDTTDSTALSAMSTEQISTLVTSLKEEKGKLQKLVIAQHAVIESEREANVRNRGMARDAIKLMHGARKNQKMAEKMARRERTERQRIELEYKKVSVALNNAMSIISSRQGSPNPVGGH